MLTVDAPRCMSAKRVPFVILHEEQSEYAIYCVVGKSSSHRTMLREHAECGIHCAISAQMVPLIFYRAKVLNATFITLCKGKTAVDIDGFMFAYRTLPGLPCVASAPPVHSGYMCEPLWLWSTGSRTEPACPADASCGRGDGCADFDLGVPLFKNHTIVAQPVDLDGLS